MAEIIKTPQGNDPEDRHRKVAGQGMGNGNDANENPNIAWEKRDVNPLQITAFGIGLLFSCVIVAFLMWGLFHFLYLREDQKNPEMPAMMSERKNMRPPEPRLQTTPKTDLRDLRESEEHILDNYGWLDPDKGTVRIPIDTAIEMVAKKGLPSKPSAAGGAEKGYRTIPEDSSGGRTLEMIAQ